MSSRIRHQLGLALLLLTMASGYVASRAAGPHDTRGVVGVSASLHAHIRDVGNRYGVSPDLIVAIIEAESSFNPRAVSRRGARGLMQLMPGTAATLGVGDPFDPRENIEAGVRHLRALMDQRRIPPYRQTRQYVNRILRRLDRADTGTPDASQRWRKASS